MKRTGLIVFIALGATLLGCGGADLSCDSEAFASECINSYQHYICTHGEKAVEECPTGYSCTESKDNGARCVPDSAVKSENTEKNDESDQNAN